MIRQSIRIFAIATCLMAYAVSAGARAESPPSAEDVAREYLIKAAFLYNFAKFTEWPTTAFADASEPLRICVYGIDPFGAILHSIAGKVVQGREVQTIVVPTVTDAAQCHLLFISNSEETKIQTILDQLVTAPVLTISDMKNFARSGGMINLKTVGNKIRFEINLKSAQLANLSFSSHLLNLAEIVSQQAPASLGTDAHLQ